MTPFLRKLMGMNWLLFALAVVISIGGIVAIYSATYFRDNEYWHKQITWVTAGVAVFLITSLIHYKWVKWVALPMYLSSIVLVILTYTHLGQQHGGAKCWLAVPGVGTFEPSQMAVIAGVLTVGLFLAQFRKIHPFFKLVCTGAIVGGPMLLILKQPDMGMTIVWCPVIFSMLWVAGIPKRYMIMIVLVAVCVMPIEIFFLMKPYQRDRITSFIDPSMDPLDTGWAINQSLIAVGSGGLHGKGFKAPNTQVEQGFIPSTTVHTDYIFTAIAEQWGFIGGITLLSFFAVLILCCLFTAHQAADEFGMIISTGFAAQLFFHVYQNMGMTIALMPITGVPLPLVSYGGTFLIMVMFALGLVNSVWVHRKIMPTPV